MDRVIFSDSFNRFYKVLISLADKKEFEIYFKSLEDHLENCRVSADYSEITYEDLNMVTGNYDHLEIEIDKAIFEDIRVFTEAPISKILPHFRDKFSLKKSIGDINVAIKSLEENDFYDRFPLYKKGLNEIRTILLNRLKIRENSENVSQGGESSRPTKKELAAKLEWIINILQIEDEQTEAVNKIKNRLREEFQGVDIDKIHWDKEKFYHMTSGKINGTGCSRFMEEIAIQLFGEENAPGYELIREMYFKKS